MPTHSRTEKSPPARKNPKGLPYLFFTEMWERFGYYLMLGIFVLYMIDVDRGGLAIADKISYDVFGTFIALTYLTPFLGGFLADKIIGYIRSVYIGGTLMGLGYLLLGFPILQAFGVALTQASIMTSFYIAVALIVIGNGFFKPSISTLLGNLYSYPAYKERKDRGYNLFYMGINIGALLGPILAAFMRNKYNWSAAFITAGIGMFLGLVVFTLGRRHIRAGERRAMLEAGLLDPAKEAGGSSIAQVLGAVFLPALIAGVIGWFVPTRLTGGPLMDSQSTDAFLFASVPVIFFYISLWAKARASEKRPIAALLAVFAVSIVFWAVFKQNGTALTNWAKYYTDREITGTVQPLAVGLYQTEKLSAEPELVSVYDEHYRALKDDSGKVRKEIGRHIYFRNLPPDQVPDDGRPVYVASPELFQAINPAWVVLLTPVVVAFFAWLRRRKMEPTTPTKIAIGLLISALSTLVMVLAVKASVNGAFKVSSWYLIFTYGVVTIGELFLSPMGLSLVSKLSPPRFTALMMGGFFLSTSLGNKLSGVLAGLWYGYEDKSDFFLVNSILLLAAALLAFAMLRWLNAIMKEQQLN